MITNRITKVIIGNFLFLSLIASGVFAAGDVCSSCRERDAYTMYEITGSPEAPNNWGYELQCCMTGPTNAAYWAQKKGFSISVVDEDRFRNKKFKCVDDDCCVDDGWDDWVYIYDHTLQPKWEWVGDPINLEEPGLYTLKGYYEDFTNNSTSCGIGTKGTDTNDDTAPLPSKIFYIEVEERDPSVENTNAFDDAETKVDQEFQWFEYPTEEGCIVGATYLEFDGTYDYYEGFKSVNGPNQSDCGATAGGGTQTSTEVSVTASSSIPAKIVKLSITFYQSITEHTLSLGSCQKTCYYANHGLYQKFADISADYTINEYYCNTGALFDSTDRIRSDRFDLNTGVNACVYAVELSDLPTLPQETGGQP